MKRSLYSVALVAALVSTAHAATPDAADDGVAANRAADDRVAALEARLLALEADTQALRQHAAEADAALQAARAEIEVLKQASAPVAGTTPAATTVATAPTNDTGAVAPVEGAADVELAVDDTYVEDEPYVADEAPAAPAAASSANAFNPAISLLLTGQAAHHSLDADEYERAGFPLAGEAGQGEDGLSLGETEIAMSANIDDKFYGQLSVALESEDGEVDVGVEEAFVDTTALPGGLSLRLGRFFSGIGYLNNHHAHTDSFSERPLAYQAFLGNQYGDDGVQLRWLAPTDVYLEFGGELLRGANYPAGGAAHDGVGAATLFAHVGGDVGFENSWLAGVSMLDTRTEDGDDGFSGDLRLLLADFTWKWAPDGNTKDGGVQLRTEWFHEDRDGTYADPDGLALVPWDGTRTGAYVEGVYRFNFNWETGYRYDRLWAADEGPFASDFDPYRHSLMLAWRNSEFSLFRLMLARDFVNDDATDDVISLQYQTSLGAHGAHKF